QAARLAYPTGFTPPSQAEAGGVGEVFGAFLRLGLTSFGGPVAHLGYFRHEFVQRRRWLDDAAYAELVALCQFLPGPASSQTGMALGLARAGWAGMAAAWIAFTLPSALFMLAFALGLGQLDGLAASGALHGLKLAAVAVVAQAVWSMGRSLCPDRARQALALGAAIAALLLPAAWMQVGIMLACGLAGWRLLPALAAPAGTALAVGVGRRTGLCALLLFALLLAGLPLWAAASGSPAWQLADGFYRAGALVFGGGHVVLPLLQAAVVPGGEVSQAAFLAGYGAAQAVPGPLFSFAAFLGALLPAPLGGWPGALACTALIFLPGALLLVGALPFWNVLRGRPAVRAALAGVNAGVVGILLAALYDPVWTGAVASRPDFAIAAGAFGLLAWGRLPPLAIVALCAAAGALAG
ncbi:chromate efflux transporter, partial [Bordetella pertussis]|uniref:chromate efflux transporter n=1 Tax=Bordetella pertussis TaxID=520 RepID=UPI003877D28E